MLELRYSQALEEKDIKEIRQAVQGEAVRGGLTAQHGFMLLFVVDELVCNVMEHARAGVTELTVQASPAGFRLTLLDDGAPFDTAGQALAAAGADLRTADDRKLGLNLVGRLVDELEYRRTQDGRNRLELAKSF